MYSSPLHSESVSFQIPKKLQRLPYRLMRLWKNLDRGNEKQWNRPDSAALQDQLAIVRRLILIFLLPKVHWSLSLRGRLFHRR